jgi:hypothetical protein
MIKRIFAVGKGPVPLAKGGEEAQIGLTENQFNRRLNVYWASGANTLERRAMGET